MTNAPNIFCFGEHPYICHGFLGCRLLEKEGYPKHAWVCERHTGTGLSKEEIIRNNLPLPHEDLRPISMEEQLICFADKFYSKSGSGKEKSVGKIRKGLAKYGESSVNQFDIWCKLFLE
jgi:uncharacterized protein